MKFDPKKCKEFLNNLRRKMETMETTTKTTTDAGEFGESAETREYTQWVAVFKHTETGIEYIDWDGAFYNWVDRYNGENTLRYEASITECKFSRNLMITYYQWRTNTSRDDYRNMTWAEFNSHLNSIEREFGVNIYDGFD